MLILNSKKKSINWFMKAFIKVKSSVYIRERMVENERGSRILKTTNNTNKPKKKTNNNAFPLHLLKSTQYDAESKSRKKATITWVVCIITGPDYASIAIMLGWVCVLLDQDPDPYQPLSWTSAGPVPGWVCTYQRH